MASLTGLSGGINGGSITGYYIEPTVSNESEEETMPVSSIPAVVQRPDEDDPKMNFEMKPFSAKIDILGDGIIERVFSYLTPKDRGAAAKANPNHWRPIVEKMLNEGFFRDELNRYPRKLSYAHISTAFDLGHYTFIAEFFTDILKTQWDRDTWSNYLGIDRVKRFTQVEELEKAGSLIPERDQKEINYEELEKDIIAFQNDSGFNKKVLGLWIHGGEYQKSINNMYNLAIKIARQLYRHDFGGNIALDALVKGWARSAIAKTRNPKKRNESEKELVRRCSGIVIRTLLSLTDKYGRGDLINDIHAMVEKDGSEYLQDLVHGYKSTVAVRNLVNQFFKGKQYEKAKEILETAVDNLIDLRDQRLISRFDASFELFELAKMQFQAEPLLGDGITTISLDNSLGPENMKQYFALIAPVRSAPITKEEINRAFFAHRAQNKK